MNLGASLCFRRIGAPETRWTARTKRDTGPFFVLEAVIADEEPGGSWRT